VSRRTRGLLPQVGLAVVAYGLALGGSSSGFAQQSADKPKPKKVWTDDDLKAPGAATLAANAVDSEAAAGVAGNSGRVRYTRDKDPKWYARELQPLREELAKVDTEIRSLQEARKDGKGASGAVDLEEEPEGVSPDAQMDLLKSERAELVRKIDELEEQGRHNAIAPGDLRDERLAQSEGVAAAAGTASESAATTASSDIAKELEREIADGKEQLEHSMKEADLLQRDLKLELQQEKSSPEQHSRRDKTPESVLTTGLLNDKQVEAGELEKKIAELEDKLKEEQLNAGNSSDGASAKSTATASPIDDALSNAAEVEAQWRKQFASIDYKIRLAKTELDILQRELNLGQMQYSPNPSTTMKEEYTRKKINEHRKAIDDKKKQLVDLNAIRAELEEELRHAGGPPAWERQ
jgi:hypothetical protein